MIKAIEIKKLVIAHRGASAYEQDNTLESFQRAIDQNADMIEFDVRKTKDDVIIAFHDATINRRPIGTLTFAELNTITEQKGFRVPTLEEVLQTTRRRIKLDIEFKETGYETDIMKIIENYCSEADFMVTSFKDHCLSSVKKICSDITTGLLIGEERFNHFLLTNKSVKNLMERCRKTQADFIAPSMTLLRFGFLRHVERLKKSLVVWTVNDSDTMSKLFRNDYVAAIITDKPDVCNDVRHNVSFPAFLSFACNHIA